jgi:hypothetical protein
MTNYCKDVQIISFIFIFANLDTYWVRLMLINEELRIANNSKSKRPRSQASEGLATSGIGKARPYHTGVPPSLAFARSNQATFAKGPQSKSKQSHRKQRVGAKRVTHRSEIHFT